MQQAILMMTFLSGKVGVNFSLSSIYCISPFYQCCRYYNKRKENITKNIHKIYAYFVKDLGQNYGVSTKNKQTKKNTL